ncbi:MAG: N-acetylneuraminate synthase [Bacteroidetes bacterium]|nr:MAG: N-acetylneuraminate synthase [Bacteroidota bacterium]
MIIAEIAQAHDGSLGILHSYIDALAQTGVDAIKFQTHIAEAESSIYEPFRVKFSYVDATRYDYWKRMEFTLEQWVGIKQHCDAVGVEFMSSPFSNAAVDILEEVGVKRYKIGSGEVTNTLLLEKIVRTGKPVIVSSGMSNLEELDTAINYLKQHNIDITLLQCTTAYPTQPTQWGLNAMDVLRQRYGLPVGFSDHSGNIFACLAATALGAAVVEFHAVFDQLMFGPDAKASIDIKHIPQMITGIRQIRQSLDTPVNKDDIEAFAPVKKMFEKSLCVNKRLPQGHILQFDDLDAKKPAGYGIDARDFPNVLGRALSKDLERWDFLSDDTLRLLVSTDVV